MKAIAEARTAAADAAARKAEAEGGPLLHIVVPQGDRVACKVCGKSVTRQHRAGFARTICRSRQREGAPQPSPPRAGAWPSSQAGPATAAPRSDAAATKTTHVKVENLQTSKIRQVSKGTPTKGIGSQLGGGGKAAPCLRPDSRPRALGGSQGNVGPGRRGALGSAKGPIPSVRGRPTPAAAAVSASRAALPSGGTNKSGPKPTPKSQPQSVVSAAATLSSASKRALAAGRTTRSAEKPKPKPKSQPRPNVSTGKKRVGPCEATGARKEPVIRAVPSRRSAPSVRARGRAAPSAPD